MAASPPRAPRTVDPQRRAALDLYERETASGWWRWFKRGLIALGAMSVLVMIGVGLLVYADSAIAADGSTDFADQVRWAWEHGDHLHYAGHLAAARLFDLCPCTRRRAAAHYYYARFHAVTPRQKAVLANVPGNLTSLAAYVTGPIAVGFDWVGDGFKWLGGQRPARQVVVSMDDFAFQPEEIHILRGTSVRWVNVDQQGEAHTVTADPGQFFKFDSDWLEGDDQFEFLFTARGRYLYYCRVHGAPQLGGMSAVIVVE
jgi:plastocyanin